MLIAFFFYQDEPRHRAPEMRDISEDWDIRDLHFNIKRERMYDVKTLQFELGKRDSFNWIRLSMLAFMEMGLAGWSGGKTLHLRMFFSDVNIIDRDHISWVASLPKHMNPSFTIGTHHRHQTLTAKVRDLRVMLDGTVEEKLAVLMREHWKTRVTREMNEKRKEDSQ